MLFDETLEIADDCTNDWMVRQTANGDDEDEEREPSYSTVPNHEHINRSRLRIDTRNWYISKVLHKKFGDKLDLTMWRF